MKGEEHDSLLTRVALWFVLSVSFFLRFYALEVPSMWWDEILVPLIASKPVEYILQRARTEDFHPPYFYLAIKAVQQFGISDFALRLPSALCGTISVYAIYKLIRIAGNGAAALLAAAFVSGMPLHLLMSRQVRPYAIIFLLSCMTLAAGVKYLRDYSDKNFRVMVIWNALLGLWHYSTFLFTFSNYVFIFFACIRKSNNRTKFIVNLCIGASLAIIPALLFYHTPLSQVSTSTFSDAIIQTFYKLYEGLWDNKAPVFLVTAFVLCVLGASRVLQDNSVQFLYFLFILMTPVMILGAMRYGSYFNAWHLFAVTPVSVLLLSYGLSTLLRDRYAACASIALCGLFFIFNFYVRYERFYEESSHSGQYKQWAKAVPSVLDGRAMWVYQDGYDADCTAWYSNQFSGRALTKHWPDLLGDPLLRACFLRFNDSAFSSGDGDFVGYFDRVTAVTQFGSAKLYYLELDRVPRQVVTTLPYSLALRARPDELLKNASWFSNITFDPYFGCSVIPNSTEKPGVLEYHFSNTANSISPNFIAVDMHVESTNRKNSVKILYRFDSDDWTVGCVLDNLEPSQTRRLIIAKNSNFQDFHVRVELIADHSAPTMTGNATGTLRLRGLNFYCNSVDKESFVSHSLRLNEAGIEGVERDGVGTWRWAEGPETRVLFYTQMSQQIVLDLSLNNPFPDQRVWIEFNGEMVKDISNMSAHPWLQEWTNIYLPLQSRVGNNELVIHYAKWNGKGGPEGQIVLNELDKRPLSLAFGRFLLNYSKPPVDGHLLY